MFKNLSPLFKIGASTTVAGLGMFYYFGGFAPIEIQESGLDKQLFLYKEQTGDYRNKYEFLNNLQDDLKVFDGKNFTYMSVFLDNPRYVKDSNKERSIMGATFDTSQRASLERFVETHPEYNMVQVDDMKAISTKFPYRSQLSFDLMNLKGVYGRLCNYGKDQKKIDPSERYFIERYPSFTSRNNVVEVMIPFGRNSQQLHHSSLPAPAKKEKLSHAYFTP